VDSGECVLSPDFTILIGKNESGKTAILEALRDFDREQRSISSQAVSINGMHGNPELELTFQVSSEALDAALQESGFAMADDLKRTILSHGIKLRKSFEGEYKIVEPAFDFTAIDSSQAGSPEESDFDRITAKKQRLSEILDVYPVPDLKFGQDVQALQESISDLRRLVKSRLNFINDEAQKVEAVEILHAMTNSLSPKARPATPRDKLVSSLVKYVPRFIYFSDFKDILPFEISIEGLKGNQTVCDFANLAQLDLDEVISTQDLQRRINLLNRASANITGAFFDHWEQDRIELIARPEGNKILFGVKEHSGTDFYKMEQRSRGFQWFLSFYLRINRYQNENVVLLIDEPGMNLHPMAQKNILKVMENKASPLMQILFSTHSPSLIDNQRLDRIRCVVKSKAKGSVIITGITDAVDMDTLMPVSTVAGVHSYEKLKALFAGEKISKEHHQAPVVEHVVETKQPVVTLHSSNTMPNESESTPDEQLLRAEKILKEKAAKKSDIPEEELEMASRKSLFKFFGR
jgi:predicted ATP-dependent endonuclease of OLD family